MKRFGIHVFTRINKYVKCFIGVWIRKYELIKPKGTQYTGGWIFLRLISINSPTCFACRGIKIWDSVYIYSFTLLAKILPVLKGLQFVSLLDLLQIESQTGRIDSLENRWMHPSFLNFGGLWWLLFDLLIFTRLLSTSWVICRFTAPCYKFTYNISQINKHHDLLY